MASIYDTPTAGRTGINMAAPRSAPSQVAPGQYPGLPNYQPAYDPLSMSASPELVQQLSGINLNTQGLDAYRKQALRTGPSSWADLQNSAIDSQTAGAKQSLTRDQASQLGTGESALAMRGGLTSGARERLQTQGNKDFLDMSQNLSRQQGINKQQIGIQDEQNRIQQLGALPGMENQALQPAFQKAQMQEQAKQFDIGQQTAEGQRYNDWTQNIYGQQMQAWGANQQAQATRNSGGSCWLISAIARGTKLPADQAPLLTQFKYYLLQRDPQGAKFYIRKCGALIERMDANEFNWKEFQWFNHGLVSMLRKGELEGAYLFFRTNLISLIDTYWPTCRDVYFTKEFDRMLAAKATMAAIAKPELAEGDKNLGVACLQNLKPEQFQTV